MGVESTSPACWLVTIRRRTRPITSTLVESDSGFLYLYYDDGNTKQWVQITSKTIVDQISIVGAGFVGDPLKVGIVDCGSY